MTIFKRSNFVPIAAFLSLLIYSYNSIVYVGYLTGNSSWVAYSVVIFDILALFCILSAPWVLKMSGVSFATAWSIWVLLLFFLLQRGGRNVLIFNALFAPAGYMMFYYLSYKSEEIYNTCRLLGVGLFLFCLLFVIYVLINGETYILGESTSASNLSYWPLCLFPFAFLVEKKIIRTVFIILMVIVGLLTVKRGAIIILFFIILAYLQIFYFRYGKSSPGKILFAGIMLIVAYFAFNHFLGYYLNFVAERMGGMTEDQGSGRGIIYTRTIEAIRNSGFIDLLIGHGCYSFPQTGYSNAHNDLLQMMYEYGVIGAVFYLVLIIERIFKIKKFRKQDDSIYMAFLSSIFILVVMGLVSNIVPSLTYFVFITSLWGLLEGKIKRERRMRS